MTEKEKLAALEKTLKDIEDISKGPPLIFDSPTFYPEQFFDLPIFPDNLTNNSGPIEIHNAEWDSLKYRLNTNHRKNKKIKCLEKQIENYLGKPGKTKQDFFKHFKFMFNNHPEFMTDDTKNVVREWLANHLILLESGNPQKSPQKESPKDFAQKNWVEILKLIRQNEGKVMTAIKIFCGHNKTSLEINSITRAVSRICKTKDIKHKKNFF